MDRSEALKIVRENYPHFGTTEPWLDLEKALDTLIPELRESEDERIRKAILGLTYIDGIEPILTKCSITAQDIRAYLEKQKEQNPAEWSEEDEEMLNLTKTQLRILQSHLSHAHSESMSDMEYSSRMLQIEKCVSWLDIRFKSLRPDSYKNCNSRWKPSEEQMEAFRSYIKDFQEKAEAAVGGWNNFDVMIRLYEQLKKLM